MAQHDSCCAVGLDRADPLATGARPPRTHARHIDRAERKTTSMTRETADPNVLAQQIAELARRMDRQESIEQIRQLPYRYALAADSRDIDAVAELYVEDAQATRTEFGREALKQWF